MGRLWPVTTSPGRRAPAWGRGQRGQRQPTLNEVSTGVAPVSLDCIDTVMRNCRAAVTEAAHRSGRPFAEPVYTGHAPDHPATFDEARYLKAAYLRFEPR